VAEGHVVVFRGKRCFVADYAAKLAKVKLRKQRMTAKASD
jgi:hypothetical protein